MCLALCEQLITGRSSPCGFRSLGQNSGQLLLLCHLFCLSASSSAPPHAVCTDPRSPPLLQIPVPPVAPPTPYTDRSSGRLSADTKLKLCQCLNPPNPCGNDWRMLAQMMQVNRSVDMLEEVDVVKGNMTCRYVKWIVYWYMPGDWIISVRQNVILPHNNINVFI